MPPRSLRWIRAVGHSASRARAVGATAAVAEAAAVVFMNARRFISYGEVMTLPLQLNDPGIVTLCHSRLDGRHIASTFFAASIALVHKVLVNSMVEILLGLTANIG